MREVIMRLTPKPFEQDEYADIVQDLVRCKDCLYIMRDKLKQDGTEDMRYKPDFCDLQKMHVTDEYFCTDGERRER